MLIDMHNHTTISSSCSLLTPEELIITARLTSLDAICVTEHSRLEGAEVARELGFKLNFPVFRGIEARTDLGDMLVFGWYKDIPDGVPLADLCSEVFAGGGVIFAAHPFHTRGGWNLYSAMMLRGIDLTDFTREFEVLKRLTGIEIVNGNVRRETNELAGTLASTLGLPGIGGSDAHEISMIGKAATFFKNEIKTESELVQSLKNGSYEALRLRN